MPRTRRHKFLQISILFLVYSIIHALCQSQIEEHSDSSKIDVELNHRHTARRLIKRNPSDTTNSNKNDVTKETTSSTSTTTTTGSTPTTPSTTSTSTHSTLSTSTARSTHSTSTTTTVVSTTKSKSSQDASNEHGEKVKEKTKPASETPTKTKEESKGASGNKSEIHKEGAPQITTTVKTIQEEIEPDERNCTPPAIQQFPKPLIDPYARKHGAIIIHILVAVYTFFGLAIVCDEYFVASLDRICEELKMSPDVAGATFMAAGSSAPELATVIIGVFFAKDDIGISGVIGSAVFNIMFVISVCALCSGTVAYLNWWPLVRDCFFYAVSILVLLISIYNKRISWIESTCMLLMYGVYCVALHFNSQLERWAQTWPVPCKKPPPATEQSGLVTYKTLDEDTKNQNYGAATPEYDFTKAWDDPNQGYADQLRGPELNQIDNAPPPAPSAPPAAPVVSSNPYRQDYYRPKEYDPSTLVDPLVKPADGSLYVQAKWYLIYPIHFMCKKTMPDCRSERYKNWYPFTFFISMVWISFYSYFMVWMITIIGSTLAIPDTVMGLTFVAAGVSVPDALSSIAVIKEGYGDMAVSNAIGSNVFDILMCLGLPWFIKTAIVKPGSEVRVISKGLTYSTLSLLSTVVFLLVATHLNGWKLDKKFGIILMVWYLIFITFASMYELNVFGPMNPPECPTDY